MRGAHEGLTSLPLPLGVFVGRQRELADLRLLLTTARLLTLTGPGGVGKTRLALELASTSLADFSHGSAMANLGDLADASLLTQTVASALGVTEQAGRSVTDTLVEWTRNRELLLVLDNCEHLVQACAELAERLLHAAPQLRILATSREPLGLTGETAWRVPSLSLPRGAIDSPSPQPPPSLSQRGRGSFPSVGQGDDLDVLRQSDAVQLFLARADADFRLDGTNAASVVAICRALDGLPLAIELAAARTRVLSVADIAARLDDRLRLLTGGSRTAPARQQTLRATLQWSYDLLSPTEQVLLGRLSVFAGSWTLAAAEAVCADADLASGEILDLLAMLVDKSLVLAAPVQRRYRLQESVRLFGQECVTREAEAGRLADRHARFFLELAEHVSADFIGPDEVAAVERLRAEDDNLRTALRHLLKTNQSADARRLGAALGLYWFFRSAHSEGRAWLDEVLAQPGPPEPTPSRAHCLFCAANLALAQGEYAAGLDLARASLDDWRILQDDRQAAAALSLVGQLTRLVGDYAGAETILQEARIAAHITGYLTYEVLALLALIDMPLRQGKLAGAMRLAEEGLERARASGRPRLIAHALRAVADVHFEQGDPDSGRAFADQSVALMREDVASTWWLVLALMSSARAAIGQHDFDSARSVLDEALRLSQDMGNLAGVVEALEVCAYLASAQRQPRRALRLQAAATHLRGNLSRDPLVPIGERMRRLIDQQVTASLDPSTRQGSGVRARP